MKESDLMTSIDLMFRSPAKHLTMEFQGGEPTLVSDLIQKGILYAEQKNQIECRQMTYVICSNSVNVSDEFLEFCKQYNVVFPHHWTAQIIFTIIIEGRPIVTRK